MAESVLPGRLVAGYAVGSLGAGLYATVPGILLLYYMTQTLGLPMGLASLAILLPKLVVVVADPLIGTLSDRTRSRWGPRRPFLLAGSILAAVAFVLLFGRSGQGPQATVFVHVSLSYLALSLSHSLFAVPYVAMPAEIAPDPAARARIIGWRMSFVFAGVLVGAALPPVLVSRFGGGAAGYSAMAWVVAAVCLASMLGTVWSAGRLPSGVVAAGAGGDGLASALRAVDYRSALAVYFLIMVGGGIASAAAPYFVATVLDWPESRLGLVLGGQIVTALFAMGAWARAVPRFGYVPSILAALAVSSAGHALFSLAGSADLPLVVGAGVLAGLGAAGVQVAAFALLAETIARLTASSGRRLEGLMTGIWTGSEKVAMALGPAACAMILGFGGFEARAQDQSAEAQAAVRAAISGAPVVLWLIAAAVLWTARGALARSERSG